MLLGRDTRNLDDSSHEQQCVEGPVLAQSSMTKVSR